MKRLLFGLIAFFALNVNAQQGTQYVPTDPSNTKLNLTVGGLNRWTYVKDLVSTISAFDYVIDKVGSNYIARPKDGTNLSPYAGVSFNTVMNNCIIALNNSGKIQLSSATFIATDAININGAGTGDPTTSITISGNGASTRINQNTIGKDLFVIKNRAWVNFNDIAIGMGANTGSAFLLSNTGANSEYSLARGTFTNIYINSGSTTSPAFRGINFLGITSINLAIYQTGYTNLSLENISNTTNYGNSTFYQTNVIAPANNAYAGISITSTNGRPMNLNNFYGTYVGAAQGYGQTTGNGIYIKGGATNNFNGLDVEYMANPIVIDGVTGSIESGGNSFTKGLLYPSDAGTAISCVESANDNSFDLRIEGDNTAIQIINDLQQFRPANSYNLYLGASLAPATKINIVSVSETPLSYRQNAVGLTYTSKVKRLSATDARGDMYYRTAGAVEGRIPIGANNTVLGSNGSDPAWVASTGTGNVVRAVSPTFTGTTVLANLRLTALNTAPASATATGTVGEVRWANGFMYLCVATNSWQRVALVAW